MDPRASSARTTRSAGLASTAQPATLTSRSTLCTIEEALTVRAQVGRVSEVTWSKVQATGMTIARTHPYALRQLDAIAEKLEKKANLGEIAKATKEAEPRLREWLAVLARTFEGRRASSHPRRIRRKCAPSEHQGSNTVYRRARWPGLGSPRAMTGGL